MIPTKNNFFSQTYDFPKGQILITAGQNGITSLKFINSHSCEPVSNSLHPPDTYISETIKWLDLYFEKQFNKLFTLRLDFSNAPPFYLKIWQTLMLTEPGEIITYAELAGKVNSKAYRAVGSAMRRNPFPVIVPCHRVVSSSGLGGYTPGTDLKIFLLEHENPGFTL